MSARDRVGLPASVDELIGRHVDTVIEDLKRRYSQSLAHNRPGTVVMTKVVRRATVAGLMSQLEVDGHFVGHFREAGPDAWGSWQGLRRQTPTGSEWPAQLGAVMPSAIEDAGASVASAAAEMGLRERRPGEARRVGEQAAEAGAALARWLTDPPRQRAPGGP